MAQEALIVVTVYNRLSWSRGLPIRLSQHAVLGRQSLEDHFNVIPCVSKEFPVTTDETTGQHEDNEDAGRAAGCVLCIEGLAYGDGRSRSDYAE